MSLYEEVGGQPFFDELVERFYEGVATDPVLRPLYPDDLTDPKRWLAMFFAQYWGGPPSYSEEKGHPRLRMRHSGFRVGEPERDAWLRHMLTAIDEVDASADAKGQLVAYVTSAADFMLNSA